MEQTQRQADPVATPHAQGYSVPARFERHDCTLVTYPPIEEAVGTDVDGFREEIVALATAIARFEPVKLVVDPRDLDSAKSALGDVANIEFYEIPVDCCWIRDNGPIFVRNGDNEVAGVHFDFNGWGGRTVFEKTRRMPARVIERLGLRSFHTDFICEGGGVSFDGDATVITTEQVMLNPNRYAGYTREDVEQSLQAWLGIERVIWLELGLVEDTETDGHVDNEVEFVAPGVVLVQTTRDKSNPNYDLLADNLQRLSRARDARGRKLEIIEMDVLPYAESPDANPLVIPYTNAYVLNDAIIAPEVDPKLDQIGYRILEQAYPGRTIVPVPSYWQAVGGGGIGCVTQQVPAAG
ncbi:MAG: agmatine deiminase family protein [Gammaproteobacteria bacterium]|nr:agmatine deiminase family protein [Gammaproteobacteria bacterium]